MSSTTHWHSKAGALRVVAAAGIAAAWLPLRAATADAAPAGNPSCSDLGYALELRIDPPAAGHFVSNDGLLAVDVTFTSWTGGAPKVMDWTSDAGVDAVLLKAGRAGHGLYEYSPEAFAGSGLTTPNAGGNAISHILFCYDATGGVAPEGDPEATPTPSPIESTPTPIDETATPTESTPEETPAPVDETPTPTEDTPQETPTSIDETPTPTEDTLQETPTPIDETPTPTEDTPEETPTSVDETPTPTEDTPEETPTSVDETPTPTENTPEETPTPSDETPTPTESTPEETPTPIDETPTPTEPTPEGTPTPKDATPTPIDETPAPTESTPEETPTPVDETPTPTETPEGDLDPDSTQPGATAAPVIDKPVHQGPTDDGDDRTGEIETPERDIDTPSYDTPQPSTLPTGNVTLVLAGTVPPTNTAPLALPDAGNGSLGHSWAMTLLASMLAAAGLAAIARGASRRTS